MDIGGTNYPRRQCFCTNGYFGVQCSRQSKLREEKFDKSKYSRVGNQVRVGRGKINSNELDFGLT